jgi:lipoate-protein ligase A
VATPPRADRPIELELALDEVLLNEGGGGARLWTTKTRAAVLGISSRVAEEIDSEECERKRVAVLRRMSGGATVLIAPGVLCYSHYLLYDSIPDAKNISGAYRFSIGVLKDAFDELGMFTGFEPPCDVTYAGRKIVGIAQARRRAAALVHGAIPVSRSSRDVARFLPHPPEEPAYRNKRSHEDFMTTVKSERPSTTIAKLAAALTLAAHRAGLEVLEPTREHEESAGELVEKKYGNTEWNLRR